MSKPLFIPLIFLVFLAYRPTEAQTKADTSKVASDSLFTIPRADLRAIVARFKAYQSELKTEYDQTEGKIQLIQQMLADTTGKANDEARRQSKKPVK